jgi:hypothetical protein
MDDEGRLVLDSNKIIIRARSFVSDCCELTGSSRCDLVMRYCDVQSDVSRSSTVEWERTCQISSRENDKLPPSTSMY